MDKRIWASLDDYILPSEGQPFLGRTMANFYFFSALLRYGTFDEYHFFLSNPAHCTLFLKQHAAMLDRLGMQDRVRVFDRLELKHAVSKYDYTVFHQSDHITLFNKLCRFRNSLGADFPVTGFIHSISYQQYMSSYLEMIETGATEKDALICSSMSGKRVLENCFDRLSAHLPHATSSVQLPVIPLGIDEGSTPPSRDAAREQMGINREEVVALAFGRFSEVDKMDLFPLIQAFKHAIHGNPHCRLVLAGSVHSRSYLKMVELWTEALGVKKQVRLVTDPSESHKWRLFGAADFFVSLSDNPQETFGLTILEAMWAGLPLLVSDFDGYRELVTDAVGIRVPTYWMPLEHLQKIEPLLDDRTFHLYASQSICVDVEQLTAALTSMFRDDTMRRRMSAAGRARFLDHYAHRHIIRRLEALWHDLKADSRPIPPCDDWMSLDTFNTFSHYVSRQPSDDESIRTTAFGRHILNKRGMHPLLPNMGALVDNGAVVSVMRAALTPLSISDLLKKAPPDTPDARYLLLWMLKHGLLTMDSQPPK